MEQQNHHSIYMQKYSSYRKLNELPESLLRDQRLMINCYRPVIRVLRVADENAARADEDEEREER